MASLQERWLLAVFGLFMTSLADYCTFPAFLSVCIWVLHPPSILCDSLKHHAISFNNTTCHRSTVNCNLVFSCSLACLPSITLPLSVSSMVHCAPSQSQCPGLPEDRLLYQTPWNKQSLLSSDWQITERSFCCSREVQHSEDNRQKDRRENDPETQAQDNKIWPLTVFFSKGMEETCYRKFVVFSPAIQWKSFQLKRLKEAEVKAPSCSIKKGVSIIWPSVQLSSFFAGLEMLKHWDTSSLLNGQGRLNLQLC